MITEFIFSEIGVWRVCIFDKVTVCWVPESPFWPYVKKRDHLDPNFGKIISENIFDLEEDTLGIILSPISGLEDH